MNIRTTLLADVLLLEPEVFEDGRGFFFESYTLQIFEKLGIPDQFVQDNHSHSKQGVLRGLHFQNPQAQGKLVRVVTGEIFDIAVDLRKSSATFSKWVGLNLSSESKTQLWIPPGFAHGFYVLSDWADVIYKVTDYYNPETEQTLSWDDPTVAIEWPLIDGKPPLLSSKDASGKSLSELVLFG